MRIGKKILAGAIIVTSLSSLSPALAQRSPKDSLLQVARSSMADTTRVNVYNELAYEFSKTDLEKSKGYNDTAIALGQRIKFHVGVITGLRRKGISLASQGNFSEARKTFKDALTVAMKHSLRRDIVSLFNNLGSLSNSLNDFDSAIYFSQKSMALDSTSKNKRFIYSNLATTYRLKDDYVMAMSYHMKNLALCKEMGDRAYEGKILNNIGNLQAVMKQFDEALHYFKEAEKIYDTLDFTSYAQLNMNIGNAYSETKNFEEAEKYYKTSLRLAQKFGLKNTSALLLQNLGDLNCDRGDFKAALPYFEQSRVLIREMQDQFTLTRLSLGFALVYLHQNKYEESKREAIDAIRLSEKINSTSLRRKAYLALYRVDSARKNYKEALDYYQKSQIMYDSLFSAEKSRQIIEIQEKYESEKKAREIEALQREMEKKQVQVIQHENKLYVVGSLLVVVLCVGAFTYWRLRINRERKAHEDLIQKHKEVIRAQEEVQEKISRELHDNIGQKLIGLKMNIEGAHLDGKNFQPEELALLDEITSDIRNTSHSLSPYTLQTEGLEFAIEKLLRTFFRNSIIRYSFEAFHLKGRYPYQTEINVYRIGQELLTNVIKHASANRVAVQLYENATHLVLIVEDDGKGIETPVNKGFGLRNIETRIKIINGVFHFESVAGKTTSTIRVPL